MRKIAELRLQVPAEGTRNLPSKDQTRSEAVEATSLHALPQADAQLRYSASSGAP